MQKMVKKTLLIDTSSLVFRAYYALPPLTTAQGEPVGAVFGFASMVAKLLTQQKPDLLIFCFDSPSRNFRHQLYPDYKSNRSAPPEDLLSQWPKIREFLEALDAPTAEVEGYEADDLIATFTHELQKNSEHQVVIVSGDKDLASLVSTQVSLYDSMKESWLDESGVIKKFGVKPKQILDYLALVGDSSDNIPGVPGIGPKSATTILQKYEDLDSIYQNLSEFKPTLREKLIKGKELAYLSRKLVTLVHSPAIKVPQNWQISSEQIHQVIAFLQRYQFRSLIPTYQRLLPIASNVTEELEGKHDFQLVSPNQVEETCYLFWTEKGVMIASPHSRRPLFIEQNQKSLLPSAPWRGFKLKDVATKFDLDGFQVDWDLDLLLYVLDPDNYPSRMKNLAPNSSPETCDFNYWRKLEESSRAEFPPELENILRLEYQLAPILRGMEKQGIQINLEILREEQKQAQLELENLEEQFKKLVGMNINLNSPKQLAYLLYEKLQLPIQKKTKTSLSTDAETLEKLSNLHPAIPLILEYREVAKLKSTYIDPLMDLVDRKSRLHTRFLQTSTATGRLSSIQPNLQNIPVRTARGEKLRKAFKASDGMILASFDYSQIELRILAHFSEDPTLVKAFWDDQDIHEKTAREIFNVTQVTPQQRRIAKSVNFGIIYGQTPFGLSRELKLSNLEAQEIITNYFKKFPKVREYLDFIIQEASKRGYTETILGRRRYIPGINSKNPREKALAHRMAINAPMQGSAADIIKKAMVDLDQKILLSTPIYLLLQIHDELLLEGKEEIIRENWQVMKSIMENVIHLKVPLKVEGKIGSNWRELVAFDSR